LRLTFRRPPSAVCGQIYKEGSENKMTHKSAHRDRNSVAGPIILIGIGIFFLFSNLGWVDWSFWDVISRLWPIFIIALGLDLLIGRRSLLGSLFVAGVTIAALIGGLVWLGGAGGERGLVVEELAQSLERANRAEVTIHFGVGDLQIGALPVESPDLIKGELNRSERGERIEQTFDLRNGTAVYRLETRGPERAFPFFNQSPRNLGWNLQLNQDAPLDLTVKTGVGQSNLDLRQLRLSALMISAGVGQTTVSLPGHTAYTAVIEGGVGELVVLLPDGVAARIDVETGLGNTAVLGDFIRDGNLYTSPGYETAVDRIELRLRAGVGQVTVRSYGGR
jgi:hypothetical protein